MPIGLLGGFVDATGGGGWGPVVTPSLMTVTRHEPRLVAGGVIAAPVAARLAGRLPHAPMGTLGGGLVILVNAVSVVGSLTDLPGWLDALLVAGWLALVSRVAWTAWRREVAASRGDEPVVPAEA